MSWATWWSGSCPCGPTRWRTGSRSEPPSDPRLRLTGQSAPQGLQFHVGPGDRHRLQPRLLAGPPPRAHGRRCIVAAFGGIMLLEGEKGLVLGIANKRSIAWGIARAVAREGARLAVTYQGERLEENVRELAAELKDPLILPCDVSKDDDLQAVAASVKKEFGSLDFVVHAVAYALREEL